MTSYEVLKEHSNEPSEAEVARASAAMYVLMEAGWINSLNPEELDLIAYAALKFRGEPGDATTIEHHSSESWGKIEESVMELVDEITTSTRTRVVNNESTSFTQETTAEVKS